MGFTDKRRRHWIMRMCGAAAVCATVLTMIGRSPPSAATVKIHVVVLRHRAAQGGYPEMWTPWGTVDVAPGESTNAGQGMGPFFTVIGISGGAVIKYASMVDITLKISGTSSLEFTLVGQFAGQYRAVVA